MASKKKTYRVGTEDKVTLKHGFKWRNQLRKMVFRSEILLPCQADQNVQSVVPEERESSANTRYTVLNWYRKSGIHGITDLPRPDQPGKLSSKKISEVFTLTRSKVLSEAPRWSLRLMAKHVGITVLQTQSIWRKAGIEPKELIRLPGLSAFG